MNKMILRESITTKILIAAALAFVAFTADAQEIKGLKIGMTKDEVQALYPNGTSAKSGFTVADVTPKFAFSPIEPTKFDSNGKLTSFTYLFHSGSFEHMLDTLKQKYPQMTCTNEAMQNRMGATFTNTRCQYQTLFLERYAVDIQTSVLTLLDTELNAAKVKEQKRKAAADI